MDHLKHSRAGALRALGVAFLIASIVGCEEAPSGSRSEASESTVPEGDANSPPRSITEQVAEAQLRNSQPPNVTILKCAVAAPGAEPSDPWVKWDVLVELDDNKLTLALPIQGEWATGKLQRARYGYSGVVHTVARADHDVLHRRAVSLNSFTGDFVVFRDLPGTVDGDKVEMSGVCEKAKPRF